MYQSGLDMSLRRYATKRKFQNWYILTYRSAGGGFSLPMLGKTSGGASERAAGGEPGSVPARPVPPSRFSPEYFDIRAPCGGPRPTGKTPDRAMKRNKDETIPYRSGRGCRSPGNPLFRVFGPPRLKARLGTKDSGRQPRPAARFSIKWETERDLWHTNDCHQLEEFPPLTHGDLKVESHSPVHADSQVAFAASEAQARN